MAIYKSILFYFSVTFCAVIRSEFLSQKVFIYTVDSFDYFHVARTLEIYFRFRKFGEFCLWSVTI
jgi:hypothetical protein